MHLRMEGIGKRFGAVAALDGVSFEALPGEVTALVGENGAGKSTLMKILYGMHHADSGSVTLDGVALAGGSPREAVARGVGMVFQQFSLIPALTVRENLALALPHAPWLLGRGARRLTDVAARLRELAPDIDPGQRVDQLSVGQMQLVELAKVLNLQARLIVLDEPTAVLAPAEAERLWTLVRVLRESGLAVILITHKLQDVHACADRIAVLRGGRLVASQDAAGLDDAQIVSLMVGEHLPSPPSPVADPGTTVRLWIKGAAASGDAGKVTDIGLQLRAGELLGVAGVSGNGQTTLAEAVAGITPLTGGEIILDGVQLRAPRLRSTPSQAVAYIPEQPLRNAVAPDLSLAINLALRRISSLPFFPRRAALQAQSRGLIQLYGVRPADPQAQAQSLSGGNLQKLVAARELSSAPAVIVACYPTMGLDVTATAQIYEALFELARRGSSVLWISEDLGDLLRYSHRIAVMLGGRVVKVLDARQTQATEVGAWMTGSAS
ncbi:MAG: ATP-binding cassette domain-containing protein [Comamonadaceae bacterium]|nr:MAG: ATP-binding cassette domain-containing protein [Comamonadaceae bacterium]